MAHLAIPWLAAIFTASTTDALRDPAFFRELERLGYGQVLLGGTGASDLPSPVRASW